MNNFVPTPTKEISVAAPGSLNARSAPSELAPEQFRAMGHSLVDSIADFLGGIREAPTSPSLMPDALRTALGTREMPE
ncbi:MAG TPA: hypothetical protein VD771_03055, partial [Gemmatimonadaceae bacterium]|nr:hypothetical protein [Gemmatimonadaceae bacterium]